MPFLIFKAYWESVQTFLEDVINLSLGSRILLEILKEVMMRLLLEKKRPLDPLDLAN